MSKPIPEQLRDIWTDPNDRQRPLWKGPYIDGITQSLLWKFIGCRERFRLLTIEGLAAEPAFNHKIEYGSLWHVCEESLSRKSPAEFNVLRASAGESGWVPPWEQPLKDYAKLLARKYPYSINEIDKWYKVCKTQFPVYVDYWRRNKDNSERIPIVQEQVFKIPYTLPSSRTIYLRGKWDAVDLVGRSAIYLQENKTKGDINPVNLRTQLHYDLQTMLYLVALIEYRKHLLADIKRLCDSPESGSWIGSDLSETAGGLLTTLEIPVGGVIYNVVRRPLSGGRHSITRHKAKGKTPEESQESFYERLSEEIRSDPEFFFMRWRVEISPHDIETFKNHTLDPILEQLCDWWGWMECSDWGTKDITVKITMPNGDFRIVHNSVHWRYPFGGWNVLNEGGRSEYDEYLSSGSMSGLTSSGRLFQELE